MCCCPEFLGFFLPEGSVQSEMRANTRVLDFPDVHERASRERPQEKNLCSPVLPIPWAPGSMSTEQRLVRSSWSPAPIVQMGSLRLHEAEKHVQCLLGVSLYQAGTPEPMLSVAVSPRVPAMQGGLDRCLSSCGLSGGAAEPVALRVLRCHSGSPAGPPHCSASRE